MSKCPLCGEILKRRLVSLREPGWSTPVLWCDDCWYEISCGEAICSEEIESDRARWAFEEVEETSDKISKLIGNYHKIKELIDE